MLMFIFGAGASFDSDPQRRPGDPDVSSYEADFRPPLAMGLFTPPSESGKEVVAAFPRAAPIIMRLRQAVAHGRDVEEVLEAVSASEESYPGTAVQLLAFRAYLSRLLGTVPIEWANACQGLTKYVLALSDVDRWNAEGPHAEGRAPIACVSFNYDCLLEQAVERAFGHRIDGLNDFTSSEDVRVYKPHGSVSWRQAARWGIDPGGSLPGDSAIHLAIQQAASLEWLDEWAYRDYVEEEDFQDASDPMKVWLPALSIPVRRKSVFSMPPQHKDALVSDLGRVTTVVAVGWRARERHFLQLLQESMPSQPARLVAVAENDDAARETVDNLWQTGRFQAYAISGVGFSGFTETPTYRSDVEGTSRHPALTLADVLSAQQGGGVWTNRQPGPGLTDEPEGDAGAYVYQPYADL